MAHTSEYEIEDIFIDRLEGIGYKFIKLNNYDEVLANFREQLAKFNAKKLEEKGHTASFSDSEFNRIMIHVDNHSVYESAKVLRDKYDLQLDNGESVYIEFFSGDTDRNIYQVTHQVTMDKAHKDDVVYKNRYDVTVLINGLPLVQIELKRPGVEINEAINQINRYRKFSFKGIFRYLQLFVVSNSVQTKYFCNENEMLDGQYNPILKSLVFFWTDEKNTRINDLNTFTGEFFRKSAITEMLNKYMVIKTTEPVLMVMRPYQIYAVKAAKKRVLEVNQNGYVFACTGSGKTLTSFKLAQILRDEPMVDLVVFLIDRKDLDDQTIDEYNSFEKDCVDRTNSTAVLINMLKSSEKKMIVTTIQKMANAVKNPKYAAVMDAYKDEKVVFIIDECHRSQFGDMHKDIVRHFRKAQFFGFTGTPRFEVNGKTEGKITQTTEMLFGECLHNYLIKDAIFDNNVLGFHIEYIKTMEGDFDWDDPTLADAIDIGELYMSDERMSLIANHIIQNHKAKTRNGQYTAIFAVSSIDALVKYYDIFKKIKHDLNISGIFSYGQNEDAEGKDEHSRDSLERIIKDYNEMYGTNFSTDTFSAYHKDISDRVKGKKTKSLDILIVVNMFLTGFDSKQLSVLYVDKDLKYHDLLQAYSRTNRVEKETKPFGIIICYRNLKKRTDDALTLFSKSQDTSGIVVPGYQYFVEKFNEMVMKLKEIALFPESVDTMQNEDDQKKFVVTFRELTKYLQSLQTFIEFSFDQDALIMSEQEYQDYKSKYLMLYSRQKTDREVVSVLNDVDFCIELMESDRINVAYIMNLIRNIHFDDPKQKDYDIKHIKDELGRTDNPQLLRKVEILQAFLDRVVVGLESADEIDAAYNDFENEAKREEIVAFAKTEDIDASMLTDIISEYEFSGTMDAGNIRDRIEKPLPLLKKRSLVNRIVDFIRQHTEKYQ